MKKLLIPLILIFVYSCSTISVTSDYDKEVNFSDYKTFSFLKWREDNSRFLTPFDKARLENAVKEQMNERNYSYQETGGDLAVSIFIILEEKTSYNSYTDYYGGYGYYHRAPWGWGGPARTTVSSYNYTQGTIIFNIFDAKEKKLIWQGTAIGELDDNPATRERNIPKVVKEVFNNYPITINK
ncbi:MAG: DUF4136 domain-containing protein [Marinilabiliales bacterium]|nr:MAG: DUF4136 domain-containing protein [Marinilabiliales bacterium]